MPRYHFNVHDGMSAPDLEGHDLPGIDAAKREAVLFSANVIPEMGEQFWVGDGWRLEVTDDNGVTLFTLAFSGTLTAAGATASINA